MVPESIGSTLPLDKYLSQLHSVIILTTDLPKTHLNVILLRLRASQEIYPPKLSMHSLSHYPRYSPSPFGFLHFVVLAILSGSYKSYSSSLCNTLHDPSMSSFSGPNIVLNTFSNIRNLRFSLKVLYDLIVIVFQSIRDDDRFRNE